ncbi:unnamed protein product [Leptosia nina]|uniref:Transposase n=1 Tax=Leptosia nina TaxID=320188 RepID=A0AAV1J181_9NEOP
MKKDVTSAIACLNIGFEDVIDKMNAVRRGVLRNMKTFLLLTVNATNSYAGRYATVNWADGLLKTKLRQRRFRLSAQYRRSCLHAWPVAKVVFILANIIRFRLSLSGVP